jgi:hypothetical protein
MPKKCPLPKQTLGDFLRDPLWNLYFYFEYSDGKYFKYSEGILKAISFLQRFSNRINALFQFAGSPLQHISRYFHTGEGQKLKYAKRARQAITFIQISKSQIGILSRSIFRILFDAAPILFSWIVSFFKIILISIVTVLGWTMICALVWYRQDFGHYLEIPVYLQWITILIFGHIVNDLMSTIQAEIWHGFHTRHMVEENYQTNSLLFIVAGVILIVLYAVITTSL